MDLNYGIKSHSNMSDIHPFKFQKNTCLYCGKSFSQKIHLQEHVRIHTGERPYVCSVCNAAFHQRGSLTIHNRIHTGERPFKCHLCNYCGVSSSHLNSHMKRRHAS